MTLAIFCSSLYKLQAVRVNKILFNGDFICCNTMREASAYLIQQAGIKSIRNGYLKTSLQFSRNNKLL